MCGNRQGQMEVLENHITRRKKIHSIYAETFKNIDGIELKENPSPDFESNFWLSCITVDKGKTGITADAIRIELEKESIESRLLWKPMHMQPVFAGAPYYGEGVSDKLFDIGLCIPSGSSLSDEQITNVAGKIARLVSPR